MVTGHKKMIIWHNIEITSETVFEKIVPAIPRRHFALRDQIERSKTSIGALFNFFTVYFINPIIFFCFIAGGMYHSLYVIHCTSTSI